MTHLHRSLAGPEKSTRIRRLRADQLAGPRLGVEFPGRRLPWRHVRVAITTTSVNLDHHGTGP